MDAWIYLGSNEVREKGTEITLPRPLFDEQVIPDPEVTTDAVYAYWFLDETENRVVIVPDMSLEWFLDMEEDQLDKFPYLRSITIDQVIDDRTKISPSNGSSVTTVSERFRAGSNSDIPEHLQFNDGEEIYFAATEEMVSDNPQSCILLSEDQISSIDTWKRSEKNIAKLLDDDIININNLSLSGLISDDLLISTIAYRRMGSRQTYNIILPPEISTIGIEKGDYLLNDIKTDPVTLNEYIHFTISTNIDKENVIEIRQDPNMEELMIELPYGLVYGFAMAGSDSLVLELSKDSEGEPHIKCYHRNQFIRKI